MTNRIAAKIQDSKPRAQRIGDAAVVPAHFRPAGIAFLKGLARNNRREWFEARRSGFEYEVKQPMLAILRAVTEEMAEFAPAHVRPAEKSLMRIYRDTRFSSDKRPYKRQIGAWWTRAGLEKTSGAGFYFHVSGKDVHIAAGVYMPEREQLSAIRTYLLEHHEAMRKLFDGKRLRSHFELEHGVPLSRTPKGFPKEHPGDDLIRQRQWGVVCTLPAEAAVRPDFAKQVALRFRVAAPLVELLNTPLLPQLTKRRKPLFGLD